jgi:hypothetical protein
LTAVPTEALLPLWKRPIFWAAVKAAVFVVLSVAFW